MIFVNEVGEKSEKLDKIIKLYRGSLVFLMILSNFSDFSPTSSTKIMISSWKNNIFLPNFIFWQGMVMYYPKMPSTTLSYVPAPEVHELSEKIVFFNQLPWLLRRQLQIKTQSILLQPRVAFAYRYPITAKVIVKQSAGASWEHATFGHNYYQHR